MEHQYFKYGIGPAQPGWIIFWRISEKEYIIIENTFGEEFSTWLPGNKIYLGSTVISEKLIFPVNDENEIKRLDKKRFLLEI